MLQRKKIINKQWQDDKSSFDTYFDVYTCIFIFKKSKTRRYKNIIPINILTSYAFHLSMNCVELETNNREDCFSVRIT